MFSLEIDQSTLQAAQAKLIQRLQARMDGACVAAANELASRYRAELLQTQAPPHSEEGQIPHRYDGYREGGYALTTAQRQAGGAGGSPFSGADLGEMFGVEFDPATAFDFGQPGDREKNNTPPEFSKVQGDNEFLATFITHGSTAGGAVVGFTGENSHVTTREQNYLIQHDQGKVPEYPGKERPWVDEIYAMAKESMVDAFREYLATGSVSDSVPF